MSDLRNKNINKRFQSGRKPDEASADQSSESFSEDEINDSTLFQEVNFDNLDESIENRKKKKNRATVRVPIPRSIVQSMVEVSKGDDLLGDKSSQSGSEAPNEESKSDIRDSRIDLFEFDITQTVQDLVKRYHNKVNLEYYTYQIENLEADEVCGYNNKYIFTQMQSENTKCYQIRLINLRRMLEGVRYLSTIKKTNLGIDDCEDNEPVPESVLGFFNDIDCQVVNEIDDSHKLIRY